MNQGDWNQRILKQIGLFSIIVADLLGYSGAGVAIGYLAWKKWGSPWWVLPLTGMIGLALAFYQLYRVSKKEWSD